MSIGVDRTERMRQVRNRLNANVWAFNHKKDPIPRPDRSRSLNGRFVRDSHPFHNPNVVPVFVNGQWMLPISDPIPSQSIPSDQFNFTPDYGSSIALNSHSPTLPPRIHNFSVSDDDQDYGDGDTTPVRDTYPDFDDMI